MLLSLSYVIGESVRTTFSLPAKQYGSLIQIVEDIRTSDAWDCANCATILRDLCPRLHEGMTTMKIVSVMANKGKKTR